MSYNSKYKGEEVEFGIDLAYTALQEHQDISHLATKEEIPSLNGYAKLTDIPEVPTKVSELENDSKYITLDEIPNVDLTDYITEQQLTEAISVKANASDVYNKTEVDKKITDAITGGTVDLSNYYNKQEVDALIPTDYITEIPQQYVTDEELDAKGYLTEHQDISSLATKEEVNEMRSNIEQDVDRALLTKANVEDVYDKTTVDQKITDAVTGGQVDLSNYYDKQATDRLLEDKANKTEIPVVPTNVSSFNNDAGYITLEEVPETDLSNYYTKTESSDLYQPKGYYATKEEIITVTDGDGTKYLANDGKYKKVDALPQGGTVGQVLTKTDEGAEWMDSTGGEANLAAVDTDEEELDDVDTLTFVKYTPQTLTDEQKAQAKENLGITMDDFDLSDYATNESVDQKIAAIEIPEVDLSGYAKSEDIPTKVSELENDANYISDAIYSNGVYIQDINGKLWTEEKWDGSVTPNGIAVIAGVCRFVIALEDTFTSGKRWGGNNILIEGIYTAATVSMASKDYNGKEQTDIIISSLEGVNDGYVTGAPALKSCKDFVFPDGSSGYMGAAGEWDIAMSYKESIDSALLKCGGSSLLNIAYYTSTQSGAFSIWCVHWGGKYYWERSKAIIDVAGRAFTELKVKSAKERIEELENTKQDKIQIIDHGTDDTMFELTPNILHKWGTVSSLTLTLATPEDDSVANYYMIEFTSGTTATSLSLPDTITWANDLNIEAGKTYQISILNNLGVIGGF